MAVGVIIDGFLEQLSTEALIEDTPPPSQPDGIVVQPNNMEMVPKAARWVAPPVDPTVRSGVVIPMFGEVWFDTVHILPSGYLDLGGVTDGQTVEFEVWSSYYETKNLDDLSESGAADLGLEEQGQNAGQTLFSPLESRTFVVTIQPSNDFEVNASYSFTFGSVTSTLQIVGVRSVLWGFAVDWSGGIKERYQWATSIMTSLDGTEQRVLLRSDPDRIVNFTVLAKGAHAKLVDKYLFSWQDKYFSVPYWPDTYILPDALPAGSTYIQFDDLRGRMYQPGNVVGAYYGPQDIRFFSIERVDYETHQVWLRTSTTYAIPKGVVLLPILAARTTKSVPTTRVNGDIVIVTATFRVEGAKTFENYDDWEDYLVDSDTPPTYYSSTRANTYDVVSVEPNRTTDQQVTYRRDFSEINVGTTAPYRRDKTGKPVVTQSYTWMLHHRHRIVNFLHWLHYRRGRLRPTFIPTWNSDLTLAQTVPPNGTDIYVNESGWLGVYGSYEARSHIMLKLVNGLQEYRKIISTYLDEGTGLEVLVLDSPVSGNEIKPSDIERISFLALHRLASDDFSIHWHTPSVLTCGGDFRMLHE